MSIPWGEQPTPEHVWVEDLSKDCSVELSGWCVKTKAGYRDVNDGFIWCSEEIDGYYKVHRRPEPEFKQGDWLITLGGAEMRFIGVDSGNAYVCETKNGGLTRLYDFNGCKKKETEREKFENKLAKMLFEKDDINDLWEAGFRYTRGEE